MNRRKFRETEDEAASYKEYAFNKQRKPWEFGL